jgi:hypothetical protein
MPEIIKSYIGVGKAHVRPFGSVGKFRPVGNVSVISLKHQVDSQRQPDYQRSGGGTAVRVDRIQQIDCEMTWLTFSPENWALATSGTQATVVAGATAVGAEEVVKGYKDSTVRLAHPPLAIASVKNSAGATTYTPETHYQKTDGGLYFPVGSSIVEAADLKVTYSWPEYTKIEGATGTAAELEMFFEGLNEADDDKPMLVDIWRLSMPSAEQIALIGTQLGEMQFSAECLKDPSKGSGVSSYYRARVV